MSLGDEQLKKLKDAKLKWDEAFIASPCSKRCICIPFDDDLNKLYEEYQKTVKDFYEVIFGRITGVKK
ncbi:hypothetical protein ES708_30468 [subsurface metagenome]